MSAALVIGRMTARLVVTRTRLILMGLLTLAAPGIFYLASGTQRGSALVETLAGTTVSHLTLAVPIVTLVMAGSALGDERRDMTLSFLAVRPVSRYAIAGAKIGASIAVAFGISGAGALLLGILMGQRSGEWGYVVPLLVGTFVAVALYAALFVPLGYITERATLIGFFYVFIWEFGITSWLPGLTSSSPWRTGYAALAGLAPSAFREDESIEFALGDMLPGAGGSLAKMFVVIALATLFTGWILRKRDLV